MAVPNSSSQLALIAPPQPQPRRLPPPCWSHEETAALIDSYRDKWYSLRRGNLRANDWQEVADAVAALCPESIPAKTPIQCRHKMEKLRKRYRNDLNRSASRPGPVSSSWAHFNSMHAMERGVGAGADSPNSSSHLYDNHVMAEEDDDEDDEELYQSIRHGVPSNGYRAKPPGYRVSVPPTNSAKIPSSRVMGNGLNAKLPNFEAYPSFGGTTRVVGNGYKEKIDPSLRGFAPRVGVENGSVEKLGKRKERGTEIGEIAGAVRALGDGFVRMERIKMEMAREVEAMRMDMEMKRTEMILEFQKQIVETFANAFSENKDTKLKRMGSPES